MEAVGARAEALVASAAQQHLEEVAQLTAAHASALSTLRAELEGVHAAEVCVPRVICVPLRRNCRIF